MSDELLLNGKQYVSSKKAAEETGYARDYIGQLSRGGLIDAERVGGLWYVSIESLQNYEKNAEIARSFSPVSNATKSADSSLSFEGKEYISASRASKLSGYNQDYVGQLARAGKIPSRQIGNRWYVDRVALTAHKAEKDALLAAVQSEAVGLSAAKETVFPISQQAPEHILVLPKLTYTHESSDLLPRIPEKAASMSHAAPVAHDIRPRTTLDEAHLEQKEEFRPLLVSEIAHTPVKRSRRRAAGAAVGVLTIILVLSVGFAGLKGSSTFAGLEKNEQMQSMSAAAAEAVGGVGDIIEDLVSSELVYHRSR